MQQDGVNIGLREIYDSVQETNSMVRSLDSRMDLMEDRWQEAKETDKIAREAHETANAALELAKRNDDSLKWLWRTVGAAVIVLAVGAIFAVHK